MPVRNGCTLITMGLVAVACTSEPPPPPPATTAGANVAQADTQAAVAEPSELVREVFSFRGAGRNPFGSLVEGGDIRPFLDDLRLVSITYDPASPRQSVAVLRDRTDNQRYVVRVDDPLGRMRVTEIREQEVVLTIEDFGVPRQVVLATRRAREGGN